MELVRANVVEDRKEVHRSITDSALRAGRWTQCESVIARRQRRSLRVVAAVRKPMAIFKKTGVKAATAKRL